jgi:hypothetical protein
VHRERPEGKRVKRPYQKPRIASEKMFETTALACLKCVSGPFNQFQCQAVNMNS